MGTVLSVKNLKKVYKAKRPFIAVNGISFDLKKGEILGLLGPNGSGKTTTIQMLLGTLGVTSGEIRYFGKDFFCHRSEIMQKVSFASTYTSLPYVLTVSENLDCFGRLYGISDIEAKTTPLLERFGIHDKKDKPISALSAGQITRLMVVKAFFTQPQVVLLDEPTASLDPDVSLDVCKFLLEQREKTGLSILFTSHKMEEVAQLCDRAIFLKNGSIVANDLPENLAKSVSSYQLILNILEGMHQVTVLAEQRKIPYKIEHHTIELHLDEKGIPIFLHDLMREGISYASIQIKEPSLEAYFLKLSEKK